MTRHSPSTGGNAPNPDLFGGRGAMQLVIPRSARRTPHRTRGVRGLRAQDHFLPLLVSATLLTTLALVCIAYFSLRADVLTSQQQQVSRDARIAQNMLTGSGTALALRDGKLVTVTPAGQATALAGSVQVDSIRALTGERYALYQLQGPGLVAVAANGLGAVGQDAPVPAYDALIADCGPLAPSSCHHAYLGSISLADGTYTAAFTPLFDANDSFVGAIAVAQPQATVLAPAAQFTVVLLFVGLLVTLVVLAAGVWTYNALSGEVLDALHLRLNHLATIANELERAAGAQITAAHRQERMARQISEGAREIDTLVNTMRQGHLSMHESASGAWAEMSQPGITPDPQAAMRFARAAVVMAAHVGVTTEDARTRCNHVVRLMNSVIAEGHVLSARGRETERRAMELRDVITQVERAIEEPLAPRAPTSRTLASHGSIAGGSSTDASEAKSATKSAINSALAQSATAGADPADAPLALRLGRVLGARMMRQVLRWAHVAMSQALDVVDRHARRSGVRLPEREHAGHAAAQSRADAPLPTGSDATTRPATDRERRIARRWNESVDSPSDTRSAPNPASDSFALPPSQTLRPLPDLSHLPQNPPREREASTDEFELPRLIDLTRHFENLSGSRDEQQPIESSESSPGFRGSKGKPASEQPDDDENSWRLP